jgi:2-polyprenyl-3-methyl-5-hydroxy-6-metoxy-1,4-benzoquinol methylase
MCDKKALNWFKQLAKEDPDQFHNKTILEVGSKNVNGSVRPLLQNLAASYIGVDMSEGDSVDLVVSAEKIVEKFGENVFDVLVTTEMVEHVYDWQVVISNLKRVLKPNGIIYLTTRSIGFPYHAFPYDFWRYNPEDLRVIFGDFIIEELYYDAESIGVWLKARKPIGWCPAQFTYWLFSMAAGKRVLKPCSMPFNRRVLVVAKFLIEKFLVKEEAVVGKAVTGETSLFKRTLKSKFVI